MNHADPAKSGSPGVAGPSNYRETSVGANLTWILLKNLMVGGEVAFTQGKTTPLAPTPQPAGAATEWPTTTNEWSGRIRVQRNF